MDRRLQPTSAAYADSLARRVLALEQRLDLQGPRPREQNQRYFNEPCCADCAPWTITTDEDAIWDDAGSSATFTLDDAATATALHFESAGGGELFDSATSLDFTFGVYESDDTPVWEQTYSYDATELTAGWSEDATPAAAFPAAAYYRIAITTTGTGNATAPFLAVLTVDGSCHDDALLIFGGG